MINKRTFLLVVVGLLAAAAVLGIWVLVFETFVDVEDEVFATLGAMFLFALPALGSAAMLEVRHWVGVNRAALGVGLAGVVWFLLLIWLDLIDVLPDGWAWKPALLLAAWAWALPWAAALGTTRFANALAWVRLASIALVAGLAAAITLVVLTEAHGEAVAKFLGVLAILVALGTVATPILHRVAGIDRRADVESTRLDVRLTCPRCLMEQTLPTGRSRCGRCRLRFEIEVEEPRCPGCGYLLHRLTEPRCPECGRAVAGEEVVPGVPGAGVPGAGAARLP